MIAHGTAASYNDGMIFCGNYLFSNNNSNSASNGVVATYTTNSVFTGNFVKAALAKPHPIGFDFNGPGLSNLVVADNITKNCTLDYAQLSSATGMTLARNRKADTDTTVASSDGLTLPAGFDVVTVTGATNFSNVGGPYIPNRIVTLRFTGTPTVYDSAGNLKLAGNFVATVDSTLTLMATTTGWTEVARAVV